MTENPDPTTQWKNRRRMAWVALLAIVAAGLYIVTMVPENRLTKLSSLLDLWFISLGGIVGAYMGFATWASKR
jgi:hypothetical protein|tara:strand:+ start:398 stop:616 length:219 start_codon:yes stop_codon:yes gene_type:complete